MSSSALSRKDTSRKTECEVCCGIGAVLTTVTVERLIEGEGAGCSLCEILRRAVITHAPGRSSDEGISLCHGLSIYEMVVGEYGDDRVKISVYGPPGCAAEVRVRGQRHRGDACRPRRGYHQKHVFAYGHGQNSRLDRELRQEPRGLQAYNGTTTANQGSRCWSPERWNDHLYETNEETESYICLSHCWGGHQPLKTDVSTIEARKKGINWDELPRTFQDAVVMTRALGIRYLWIDSLCIFQDDEEDWRRESSRMHIIYQGGYLTLAASSSASPDGSLFRDVPSEYSLRDWDLNGQHIRTRRKIPHIDSTRDYPLMHRGWVF